MEVKGQEDREEKKHEVPNLHSIYILCRRELYYKGRETWRNVKAFLKRLIKKSHLTAEYFSDDWQWITEWLINDKKRFRAHDEEWRIEFEEDHLGYYTGHLRRYDNDGNIVLPEIHPQDILEETRRFIYEQIEHFITTHDPTHIHGYWHFCVCASIIYENCKKWVRSKLAVIQTFSIEMKELNKFTEVSIFPDMKIMIN